MNAPTQAVDVIRARRVKGGAVVTVSRADGRVHRHNVSLRRYNRLCDTLVVHHGVAGGAFLRHGFVCHLREVQGLREARCWAQRQASRAKHWWGV